MPMCRIIKLYETEEFVVLKFLISIGIVFLLSGCATSQQSYQDNLNARPVPQTNQDKQKECSFIRQEIVRMELLYQDSTTKKSMGRYYMMVASQNIASLESRASQIQCGAAFSSTVVSNGDGSSINECIEACKKNTNRSSTQCFDRCNK